MCEWALHNNLCKPQVIVLLTCIDLTKENIIKYCGTWYGTNCDGFKSMFAYPTYFQSLAMVIWKMKITRTMVKKLMSLTLGGLTSMDDNGPNVYEAITNCEPKGHLPPWSKAYFYYKIQWLKSFLNARKVVLYFVIMQHHYYKLLHQTFQTFV